MEHVKPPNLLIIISDEHRRDTLGCMGHPIVKTPNLDALAASGTVFENAYTPSPMCVPARASIACGDHVHNIGYWDSATPYDGRAKSWMGHLHEAGVKTVSIGKLHFRSTEDDNGFSEEILPMHVVDGIGWPIGLLRENPPDYNSTDELAADAGVGSSTYTDYDLEITKAAEAWITSQKDKQSPWAAFVSLVSPHYPLTCPKKFYDLYDPAKVDLPKGFGSKRKPDHSELKNISKFFDYDRFFDEQKTREAKAAYYGLTSFMDDCVGRMLTALKSSGQAENTVVIYVSDHGDMMGDQGFWTKQVMYEASAGVPMIASGPGVPIGKRVKTGTSLIDLAPTAMDVLCLPELQSDFAGESLRAIAEKSDDPDRTVFSEYHDGGSTTGTFMVRWDKWKYVHYVGLDPQLFNLDVDPDEFSNLYASSCDDVQVCAALVEGDRRLREICDPEAVNQRCFSDQKRKITEFGGIEACMDAVAFSHTPAPK